ncbi:histidine kinase [Streptomyces inusitatus]|uniref:histidine kinase n=1 Tax=Streptomyces inusitatus TaxID=68221 RepID=A0A918QNT3_9ACTN|nr:nitrate- and nitrite sensing domain-containing protein [Streptomyces inusitatus]GGZ58731.1 histidine kinase [Streptomyces inusitatus]
MRFRGKSIRRKIVALLLVPLLSLTALWGFATAITGREADNLLDVGAVVDRIGEPMVDALDVVQGERRQTLIYLADRRASDALPTLRDKRRATDKVVAKLKESIAGQDVRDDLRSDSERRLASLVKGFDGLVALRRSVDSGTVSRAQALDYYNRIINPGFSFMATLHSVHDVDIERQGRAVAGLARAAEMLSREDALIVSALTTGKVTAGEIRRLSDFVAHRELYYEINLESLPAREREIYLQFWRGPKTEPLRAAEERLIDGGPVARASAAQVEEWHTAATPVLEELSREARASGERHQDRVGPAANGVFLQAGVAGILGFLALLVSVIVSVRVGRDLIRDLSRLRKEAHEVSGVRLPSVMRRLAAGEKVDVETEAPRLEYDKDEIGQAGQALNTLQRAAVEAAVRQADMRRGVSEVFVNLARRNQVLLHRQLTLLDAMERRTEDTDELADLFRLDHLTTRMRRHAEGLVILSGAAPSRQWRKPIQLMDVVRAAVAEVEDYERIEVRRLPRIGVGGPAVADLTHLIAELLENATVFSPPHTGVQVLGERVANGFTLEIHDRGLGMASELLLDANLRLAETPEFELSDTDRLGLFVVSRLAQRQGVRVSLQPSPYGGTTAVVFIPAPLLTEAPETQGTGFRLDRKSDSPAGRRGSDGKLSARARPSGRTPDHRDDSALFDGPVELEGPVDPLGLSGAETLTDPDTLTGPGALLDLDGGDRDRAGVFRSRSRHARRTAPDEPHPQPSDAEAERRAEPVPLPRRTPTLVADRGRRVDEPAHPRPAATPTLPSSRATAPGTGSGTASGGTGSGTRSSGTGSGSGSGDDAAPALIDGLPRRVRQANLAPQLRAAAPDPRTEDREPGRETERDAEEVRSRMASMQRGWQRGRLKNAHGDDEADRTIGTVPGRTAPRTTSEGDGP